MANWLSTFCVCMETNIPLSGLNKLGQQDVYYNGKKIIDLEKY
jgi:hypothetical protein